MDFGKLREKSVKIGNDRKLSQIFGCLLENVGCIPLSVIMTTANGMYLTFSGRRI